MNNIPKYETHFPSLPLVPVPTQVSLEETLPLVYSLSLLQEAPFFSFPFCKLHKSSMFFSGSPEDSPLLLLDMKPDMRLLLKISLMYTCYSCFPFAEDICYVPQK